MDSQSIKKEWMPSLLVNGIEDDLKSITIKEIYHKANLNSFKWRSQRNTRRDTKRRNKVVAVDPKSQ